MAVGTVTQFAIAALAPFIVSDLALSRTQLGALTTVMFLTGSALSPWMGRLVDRLGGRLMLVVLFLAGTAALAAIAAAPGYAWLVAAVASAGIAQAVSNPATNKLVATLIVRGRQGLLMGVKQAGVQLGALLAGGLLPVAAALVGWRAALWAMAAVALPGAPAALRLLPRGPVPAAQPVSPGHVSTTDSAVNWLSLYAFLMGIGVAAVTAYLPLYAFERLDFAPTLAGMTGGAVGLASLVAQIPWARRAEQVPPHRLLAAIAGMSVAAQLAIWLSETLGAWLLWLGVAAFGATAASWIAVGMVAVVRTVPREDAGRASGRVILAFYLAFTVSPPVFGAIVDGGFGYGPAWSMTTATFIAATGTAAWRRGGG